MWYSVRCPLNKKVTDTKDGVHNYSRVLCHYAALCLEFTDAWEHGDGERITLFWWVFLLHFRANRRTKYALEALTLQFQLATLSPSLVHQLTWGRFINTHGGRGRNIPVICSTNMSISYSRIQYRKWGQILLKKLQRVLHAPYPF